MAIGEWYVFDGYQWLGDDERSWVDDFFGAASFTSAEYAKAIGERERGERVLYVLGLEPS